MYYHDDASEHLTDAEYYAEACREYAREHGAQHPDHAWILTPFDTWEPNPSYHGPAVPHPEED